MTTTMTSDSSVRKALAILDCYRATERELGVSELARRTSIAKSTAQRLCRELADAGYLVKTDRRGFVLALRVFELGSAAVRLGPGGVASRFLQQLSLLTGETSHLAILDRSEVVYLDKIETLHSHAVPSRVGQRNPAHCTALGKALLAWRRGGCDDLSSRDGRLPACTQHTITTVEDLRRELVSVRATGVAFDREERNIGVRCTAAPVRNHTGSVIAAISVAGPADRMTEARLLHTSHAVRTAAAQLSERLGWGSGRVSSPR